MNNKLELQNKKDVIKQFFTENKQFVQTRICKDLGISLRAIYVITKTKHQSLNSLAIDKLIDFINEYNHK